MTKRAGILGLALLGILAVGSNARCQDGEFVENRWVSILSAYPSFAEAEADAKKISRESRVPFSMEGRVYDTKRGLIYPDNFDDEVWAGNYVPRRYNETQIKGKDVPYLSIERSDGYDGFRPGYYIVVAGIYEAGAEAQAQSKRFQKWAPTAYAKKTKIYMGCLH